FFSEEEPNMGRRARAYGFPTGKLDGRGSASGVWGPTWLELDLERAQLGDSVRHAIVEGVGPSLVAEIYEDSARRLDRIPPTFPSWPDAMPWRVRGDIARARRLGGGASFQLAFARGGIGNVANFMHFRLHDAGITCELAGVEPSSFEKTWLPKAKAPVFL